MRSSDVRRRSSTVIPSRLDATPAISSPRSSTRGARPVATSSASADVVRVPHSTAKRPSAQRTAVTCVPRNTSAPSARTLASTIAAASRSSRGSTWAPDSMSVTRVPSLANACANSQPLAPAPITASSRGWLVRSNTLSLVRNGVPDRPGMSGRIGRLPVAMTAFLNRSSLRPLSFSLPTDTDRGPENDADPKNTSTPSDVKRSAESAGARSARRARMRAMTDGKSACADDCTPNAGPRRDSATRRADRSMAFDGTHPVLRQSPPRRDRSTSATRAPRPAAPAAHTRPAVPPPITTRLDLDAGAGLR